MSIAAWLVVPGLLAVSDNPCGPVMAREVYDAFTRLASRELWPGFHPAQTPVAIYDGEQTWLFGHPAPPPAFVEAEDGAGGRVYPGRHEKVRANSSAVIGEVAVGTFLLNPRDERSVDELAAVIVHETFHVFQDEQQPGWTADEGALMVYPVTDAVLLAHRRYETEALRRALEARTRAETVIWIKAALAYRAGRFGELPEETSKYERGIELREGLAQYVQHKSIGRLGDTTLPADGYPAEDVRQRCYDTGQAWAVLLDRFAAEWPRLVNADGVWLDELLAESVKTVDATPAVLPLEDRHRVQTQAQRDVEAVLAERTRAKDAFLGQGGWTLRVIVTDGAEPLWPWGFDPMNVTALGDGTLLHTRWFKLGNTVGRIEVLDRKGMTIPAGDHPMFNGVREIIVTGLPAEPELFPGDNELYLGADGVSLHFKGASSERRDREIVVTVK